MSKRLNMAIVCTSLAAMMSLTGCGFLNDYNNDFIIARTSSYNVVGRNHSLSDDGMTLNCDIIKLSGHYNLGTIETETDCDEKLEVSMKATQGKVKLVLVHPNSHVEVLKEVKAGLDSQAEGEVIFHCEKGQSKLKIVGEDFEGTYRISKTAHSKVNLGPEYVLRSDGSDMNSPNIKM